jgi:hypothetical protein
MMTSNFKRALQIWSFELQKKDCLKHGEDHTRFMRSVVTRDRVKFSRNLATFGVKIIFFP